MILHRCPGGMGKRALGVLVPALLVAGVPAAAEGAAARRAGGSGLSGTLSSNRTIRQQQLVADPEPPDRGSLSISYDPTISLLSGYRYGPGYERPGVAGQPPQPAGFVEVLRVGQNQRELVDIDEFLINRGNGMFTEVGFIQMQFVRTGQPGQINPPGGFMIVDEDAGVTGTFGVDPTALTFDLRDGLSLDTIAAYTIFAAAANSHSGNAADFMTATDDQGVHTVPASQIAGVTVSRPFPEPSSAAVLAVGGLGLMARRRRARE